METATQPVIICVDDEPQILAGLSLHLGRRFQVHTATSGTEALKVMASHPDAAVVMSDMRMPFMDGAHFLQRAREMAPDTVRLLLTGQSDLNSAIAAINQGHIFRFLTKPCPPSTLLASMDAAVEHHRLITAERVLLEQTVRGVIKALTDVLALANPVSFGRASRIKATVARLAAEMKIANAWQIEVAAMLSQLGYIALASDTAERVYHGKPISTEEAEAVARVPAITEQLLGNIPRLEIVRGILATYCKPYRKPTPHENRGREFEIYQGAQLLKVATEFDVHESSDASGSNPLEIMRSQADRYDPTVLAALMVSATMEVGHELKDIRLSDLQVGMVFDEDVRMESGALMVGRGLEVTAGMVERLRNRHADVAKTHVRVRVTK
ncbi:MAG: HD domain-containing phosphohydrolase [Vicinamibacterales bacterium]